MNKEITEILMNNIHPNGMFDEGEAGSHLTALMCYREVRAFCFGYEGDIHHISDSILKVFEKDYSEYDIKRAIEKVKNDQK